MDSQVGLLLPMLVMTPLMGNRRSLLATLRYIVKNERSFCCVSTNRSSHSGSKVVMRSTLSETTSLTLPLHQSQNVSLTNGSLRSVIISLAPTLTFLTMLRLLASMKVTRTYTSQNESLTHLSDITSVTGSAQHLLHNSVLNFVLLHNMSARSFFGFHWWSAETTTSLSQDSYHVL